MSDLAAFALQLEENRRRFETALSPTPAAKAAPTPVVQPAPQSPIDVGIQMLLAKIGAVLNEEEQQWLTANIISAPVFFSSNSGKAVIRLTFEEFRKWAEK
jgi:hypothetical protein